MLTTCIAFGSRVLGRVVSSLQMNDVDYNSNGKYVVEKRYVIEVSPASSKYNFRFQHGERVRFTFWKGT